MSGRDKELLAAAWWHARRSDGTGAADHAGFEAWKAGSNDRRRAYAAVSRVANAVEQIATDPRLQAMAVAATHRARSRKPRWHLPAVALIVIAGAPLAALTLHYVRRPAAPASVPVEVTTSVGQLRRVTLPGGGTLLLDSGSRAVIRQDDKSPVVTISGQAYVSGGPAASPLIVRAGSLTIIPHASAVNVRNIAGQQDVLPDFGQADIAQGVMRGSLSAGQSIYSRDGRATIRVVRDPELVTGWRRGWLHFDNASVASAVAEMNRYRRHPILLRNAAVAGMRISGSFRLDESDSFATLLETALPVRVRQLPDGSMELATK